MYVKLDIDPANVDDNGIAENQTTAGAANLNLNGALCDLGTAGVFDIYDAGYSSGVGGVKISIDSAGDISGVTFTVTGTGPDGEVQTEDITGVTTTAVDSTKYWQTITQIAADAQVTSNVFVGTLDEIVTKTIPLNWRDKSAAGASVMVSGLTGTCQFDIDETLGNYDDGLSWYTSQSDKSADLAAQLTLLATYVRLKFDSYTNGAELQFEVRQNDL